ncbi:YbaK/EbsC family protein [Amycolatopsis sp. H20-H5]|uniref:YbaK/EbsC family protein n=1 Tax=Amycolatopsis sp. H20-H5 TaxID=3046309 RepID=UPI002DB7DCF9|nr:YbaK/EbsC family protein [Amycolatopsis sp. H20-H5]MEC3979496.1 YbaK/EbsC family protein [Amycolatopsis sp. H20-H5]
MTTTEQTTTGSAYGRLCALLAEQDAPYRLIEHEPQGCTELASELRGHDLAQAAKCLVVVVRPDKRTSRFVLAVVPGDRRLDLDKVRELGGGRKAGFASRETAERLAGCVSGTIMPFSFHPELELLVDEDLLHQDTLYFNAAKLDLSMALSTADYVRVTRPRTASISQ